MLFVLSMIISFISSTNIAMSLDRFLRVVIYYIVFWIAFENIKDFKQISNILFFSLLAGAIVSIYGIAQYFGIDPFFSSGNVYGNVGRLRIFSTFGNTNFLADYLVVPFPLAFMFFLNYSKKIKGKIAGICFLMMFLVILFTRTRGAWLSVISSTVFILGYISFFKRKLFRTIARYIGVFVIISVIFFMFLLTFDSTRKSTLDLMSTIKARFTSSTTVFQRLLMWRITLDSAKDAPIIGNGLHMFKKIYSKYQHDYFKRWSAETGKEPYKHPWSEYAIDFRHTHNDILQTLCEQGIIGLISFMLIFGVSIYYGTKLIKENKNFYLNIGLLASLVSVLTEAVFNFPFHRAAPYLTTIIVITAISIQYKKESLIEEKNTSDKLWGIIIVIMSLLVSINGIKTGYKKHIASKLHKSGHMLITQKKDFKNAEIYLRKSINTDNSEGEAFYWYSYSLYNQNKLTEAIKMFKEGFKYSNSKMMHLHLGLSYMKLKEFDKAMEQLEFVKYSDPSGGLTYYYQYLVYSNLKEPDKAEEALKTGFLLEDSKIKFITQTFAGYALSKNKKELIDILLEKVDIKKLQNEVRQIIYKRYIDKLDDNKKLELLNILLQDKNLQNRLHVINYCIENKYLDMARKNLEKMIKDHPNIALSYYFMAKLARFEGKDESIIRKYVKKYERLK